MADGEQGRPSGRVIGMEDYRAAKLRALETLVLALARRQEDPAWLRGLITETEALPLDPDWVGLWRTSQLQLLNKALYGDQRHLAPDDADLGDTDWDDSDNAVQIEVDSLLEEFSEPGAPFDYNRCADDMEREIARHLTEQHLDPPEPEFWRAVVAELRRRADDAAAVAA
jgi:hypothetical protein